MLCYVTLCSRWWLILLTVHNFLQAILLSTQTTVHIMICCSAYRPLLWDSKEPICHLFMWPYCTYTTCAKKLHHPDIQNVVTVNNNWNIIIVFSYIVLIVRWPVFNSGCVVWLKLHFVLSFLITEVCMYFISGLY